MYYNKNNLIIGFHGCDSKITKSLLLKPNLVKKSEKPYDWLGHGIYFWENNFERAFEWAKDKEKKGEINKASVIGAVLSLDYCLDLLDSKFISMLSQYYKLMEQSYHLNGRILPQNKDLKTDEYKDKIVRELDCAVIEYTHQKIKENIEKEKSEKGYTAYKSFDSVRGVFTEGGPAYTGAGIQLKNHIQICIRNTNCIKGFFLPRKEIDFS